MYCKPVASVEIINAVSLAYLSARLGDLGTTYTLFILGSMESAYSDN